MPRTALHIVISKALELFWRMGANSRTSSAVAQGSDEIPERVVHLRSLLRRYPYWLEGHLRLGDASLESNDIATGYASAMCAAKLAAPSSRAHSDATFLAAKCFLRRGDTDRALSIFFDLESAPNPPTALQEEIAAALMALGRESEALERLSRIPTSELTPAAKAAVQYLESRRSPSKSVPSSH